MGNHPGDSLPHGEHWPERVKEGPFLEGVPGPPTYTCVCTSQQLWV